jgi:TIR domain-containing protein
VTRIFLSYRSEDDGYAAALLDEKLSGVIGQQNIFRASRSVEAGENYSEAIMAALRDCHTVIVIIGPTWQEHIQKSGDNEPSTQDDWVRIEIATALRNKKRVIPLLLSRTPRLTARDLPQDISGLAYNQYLKFELRNLEMDLARLVAKLKLPNEALHGPDTYSDDHAEFVVRHETGWDGSVELDVVRRSPSGAIMGRVTGRAHPTDLARMAELIVQAAPDRPTSRPAKRRPV